MTLRLILTRHAKSGWDDPTVDDHDRPLNARGRRAAASIGAWLASHGYVPDLLLSSTAERTRETWGLIKPHISPAPTEVFRKELYLADPDTMLNILREADTARTVMLLGHNPGSGLVASALASGIPTYPHFRRYPTAATSVFEFKIENWSHVKWGSGELQDFVVPRDLA